MRWSSSKYWAMAVVLAATVCWLIGLRSQIMNTTDKLVFQPTAVLPSSIEPNRAKPLDVYRALNPNHTDNQKPALAKAQLHLDELDDPANLGLPAVLSEFRTLQRKAIRTQEEDRRIEMIIESPAALDSAADVLLSFASSEQQSLARRRRMVAADLLILSLERGSHSSKVISDRLAKKVILAPTIQSNMDVGVRKSIAGDKLELIAALDKQFPDSIDSLLTESSGVNRKILNYALHLKRQSEGTFSTEQKY